MGFLKEEMVVDYSGYTQIEVPVSALNIVNALLLFYLTISIVLTLKVLWGLRHIAKLMRNVRKNKQNGITFIEIENSKMAFSFFNLLFIDPEMNQKATVLKHEMVHIKQRHSLDILLFEMIQISSWFNPIIYLIKNDIRLVHEYLADEATTKKDITKYDYALFLIQNSYGNQEATISNHFFNSSLLKNRISMLNQKKSAKWARLKLLFIIPLIGSMLFLSTTAFTKDYNTIQLGQKKESLTIVLQDTTKKKSDNRRLPPPPKEPYTAKAKKVTEITINEPIIKKGDKRIPPPPPVEPGSLKAKKLSVPKVDQVRFAPPIVKKGGKKLPPPVVRKDKSALPPPPPPIEPKPEKKGNDNEPTTVNLVQATETKVIKRDHTLSSDQKDIKEVAVKGYATTINAKKKGDVNTIRVTPVKEITITGYPKKQ
ncbi:M56 family metallopeptidase [Pedobacter kyonggii]|uniref:M56 family metallopeptidase n=1 Tax=Pedobacter kyonggii TaxID=1926871 RepID=UPI0013EF2494|nr:M56 family metallopeptidase [Pedobacter kyonggii]